MPQPGSTLFRRLGLPMMVGLMAVAATAAVTAAEEPSAANASAAEEAGTNDPAEGLMRLLYGVHKGIDTLFVRPIATLYGAFLPPPAQSGVRNMVNNLRSPLVFGNDLLQGEFDRAGVTLQRAWINTTQGYLGFNDKAAEEGIVGHSEDFGQTLAKWGVGEGPYLMLPVFGPSNPRDAVGLAVDFLTTPPGLGIADGIDRRSRIEPELQALEGNAVDPYAAVRSAYRQNRTYEIGNDRPLSGSVAGGSLPRFPRDGEP